MIELELAKEISLIKWNYELNKSLNIEQDDLDIQMENNYPDLHHTIESYANCGFCFRHDFDCENCEIKDCFKEDSLYKRIRWLQYNNSELRIELIKELIKVIEEC